MSSPKIPALGNCIDSFAVLHDSNAPKSDLNAKLNECEAIADSITFDLNEFKNYLGSQKGKVSDQFDKELDGYYDDIIDAYLTIRMPLAGMALIVDPCEASPYGLTCLAKQMADDEIKLDKKYVIKQICSGSSEGCCASGYDFAYMNCYTKNMVDTLKPASACADMQPILFNAKEYGGCEELISTNDFCYYDYMLAKASQESLKYSYPESIEHFNEVVDNVCPNIQNACMQNYCFKHRR